MPATKNKQRSLKTEQRFREFARQIKSDDLTVMEFVTIIKIDRSFPDVDTWQELRWHLCKIDASHNAFIGGRLTWQRYKLAKKERAKAF